MSKEIEYEFDIPSLRAATGVTHAEAKILQLLMHEEIATHEQLNEISYRPRQTIHSLRIKLQLKGVTIINDKNIGYSINPRYKLRIRNLIEGDLVEEMEKIYANESIEQIP